MTTVILRLKDDPEIELTLSEAEATRMLLEAPDEFEVVQAKQLRRPPLDKMMRRPTVEK